VIAPWSRFWRLNRLALSALILVTAAAAVPARADDWPKPSEWDRKYPFDGPNHADFYRLASIRAALLNLAGGQFYRHVILEWTVYTPIIATSDTIFVTGCKPHACDTDEVTTVIQGRKVSVCSITYFHHRVSAPLFHPPSDCGSSKASGCQLSSATQTTMTSAPSSPWMI
jgi:hypothetical protein